MKADRIESTARTGARSRMPAWCSFVMAGWVSLAIVTGTHAQAQRLPALDLVEDETSRISVAEAGLAVATRLEVTEGGSRVSARLLEGGAIELVPTPDSTGHFTLLFHLSTGAGTEVRTMGGIIHPRTDLRIGRLESTAGRETRPGIVRVLGPGGTLLAETTSDASGRVRDVQIRDALAEYTIQAAFAEDTLLHSFVRTLRVVPPSPGADVVIPVLRVVSMAGLDAAGVSPDSFRAHVAEVAPATLMRWDPDRMEGVYVASGGRGGGFTPAEVEAVRGAFRGACAADATAGRSFEVTVGSGSGGPYSWPSGDWPIARSGWLLVVADHNLNAPGAAEAEDTDGDGVYDRGVVLLNPTQARRMRNWDRFLCRTIVSALGMRGSATVLPFDRTIAAPGVGPDLPVLPTAVDRKVGALLYEPTFAPGTRVETLLGTSWDSED